MSLLKVGLAHFFIQTSIPTSNPVINKTTMTITLSGKVSPFKIGVAAIGIIETTRSDADKDKKIFRNVLR